MSISCVYKLFEKIALVYITSMIYNSAAFNRDLTFAA